MYTPFHWWAFGFSIIIALQFICVCVHHKICFQYNSNTFFGWKAGKNTEKIPSIFRVSVCMYGKEFAFCYTTQNLFDFIPFSLHLVYAVPKKRQTKMKGKINKTMLNVVSRSEWPCMVWLIQSKIGNVIGFVNFDQCHKQCANTNYVIHFRTIVVLCWLGSSGWENMNITKTHGAKL